MLAKNYANIDCHKKEVTFAPLNKPHFKFKETYTGITPKIVSMIKAERLVQQGGWAILAGAVDIKEKEKTDTVSIINKFPDVFPEDLPGVPPSRAVDFGIELEQGIGPISKALYHMAPTELKELQLELQNLLDKGFIQPSISP